ncbi:MAG: type I-B CRISPR-associated endonuclease Cas1 [Lachnospiraceae bacterium]|nr:type I-B CRISPR-associated endonuclease Cas1 [Lachnospiraceae bacterium]
MGSTRYITSMGELSRKDNSLMFRKEGKNIYIPVENTKEIYCLSEISINTKLLDFLSRNHIVMHFFNYYEGYSGTFYPKEHYCSGKLLVKQVEAYRDKRLYIAKAFVSGIIGNLYEVLYHYYKHDKKETKETIDWLNKEAKMNLNQADGIKQVLQVEGEAWQRFYGEFKHILPEEFIMNRRVKRPPDNPINALISFGNTLLYGKTVTAIYQTHLDQRISFLHELADRRFSLSLDISEAFKPVIVFRTIFDLVNNRKLQVEKHFNRKYNYCLLNEEGRNIFIKAFEERIETTFLNDKLGRKVTYRTAIKLDCYKLIKCILEDKEFMPFSLKNKY